VQVSATSKLIPVVHAANIRPGSRGNLLRQLLSANVDADLYGRELVRAIINVKWESFARAFLLMQFVQFLAFFTFFLAYMAVAVYGNDPAWSTRELLAHPEGRAALALACILMIMMFGQVRVLARWCVGGRLVVSERCGACMHTRLTSTQPCAWPCVLRRQRACARVLNRVCPHRHAHATAKRCRPRTRASRWSRTGRTTSTRPGTTWTSPASSSSPSSSCCTSAASTTRCVT
jgi:hypothetical protein